MRRPWFALWVDDFEGDEAVKVGSNRAVGAYVRLLCQQWREGSLPSDMAKLAKIAAETPKDFARLWPEMAHKFKRAGTRLKNPRLERERKAAEERSAKAREAADARWADATADAPAMPTHSDSNAQPMPPQPLPLSPTPYKPLEVSHRLVEIERREPVHIADVLRGVAQ